MFISRPHHIAKRGNNSLEPGPNQHFLTDAEYASLLYLIAHPPKDYEPVMLSSGDYLTLTSGDILMTQVVY